MPMFNVTVRLYNAPDDDPYPYRLVVRTEDGNGFESRFTTEKLRDAAVDRLKTQSEKDVANSTGGMVI